VAAILDTPVASVDLENVLSLSLLRCLAGDAVGDFGRAFCSFLVLAIALYNKSLADVRKIEVRVEFGGDPDFADFDTPMVRGIIGNKIGFLAVDEVEGNVLIESGLVAFDGEVVVGSPLLDQVAGELSLSQQGIGSDGLALDIDGIEKRDGGLDFVCPLEFFIPLSG